MKLDRPLLSINDLHIGVNRVAGTTPATMSRLRSDLLDNIARLLGAHSDKHVYVNGDIFDGFEIAGSDFLAFYMICRCYLVDSKTGILTLAQGNHDVSKDSSRMSSFGLLCAVLKSEFSDRVQVVIEPTRIFDGHFVIPHTPNQQLFDQAIDAAVGAADLYTGTYAMDFDGSHRHCYLHLHANYDNDFAVEADHSLNVSAEQVQRLTDAGYHLVFGHVHQQLDGPGLTVVGNQFPTSIADCIGNDYKRAIVFHVDGGREEIRTWEAPGSFVELDWQHLGNPDVMYMGVNGQFVRATGRASVEQAPLVLQTIAKFRQVSSAYVVSSSVKYDGQDDVEELEVAAADMKAVDVMGYLMEQLDERQQTAVKGLLALKAAA